MRRLYRSAEAESQVRAWCQDRLRAWGRPHEDSSIDTTLGPAHAVTVGTGPTTCVYLPGTNFNASTSIPLLEELADRFTVVCVDLPGQPGLSSADRPSPEREGYATWLRAVLTHVRSSRPSSPVLLVGHSRGAAVALGAAPATVDGLLLVNPAGLAAVRVTPQVLRSTLPWLLRPSARRSARLLETMTGSEHVADAADLVEWLTLIARTTRSTGAPGPLPPAQLSGWRDRNVAVIVGQRDVFFPPARVAAAAQTHLGLSVETAPTAGHLLTHEDPERLALALERLEANCA